MDLKTLITKCHTQQPDSTAEMKRPSLPWPQGYDVLTPGGPDRGPTTQGMDSGIIPFPHRPCIQ